MVTKSKLIKLENKKDKLFFHHVRLPNVKIFLQTQLVIKTFVGFYVSFLF